MSEVFRFILDASAGCGLAAFIVLVLHLSNHK